MSHKKDEKETRPTGPHKPAFDPDRSHQPKHPKPDDDDEQTLEEDAPDDGPGPGGPPPPPPHP
jgi:hypothetical protein